MGSKMDMGGVMMAVFLGLMVSFGGSSVSAEEKKKEEAGDVKERAVPRMGIPNEQLQPVQPLRPVQPPPRTRQGFVQQGNTIVAQPGFVLEPGPNNEVTARIAGGGAGGQRATMTCKCMHGTTPVDFETCTMVMSGTTTVTCDKGPKDTCQDSCAFSSTSAAPRRGRAMQ